MGKRYTSVAILSVIAGCVIALLVNPKSAAADRLPPPNDTVRIVTTELDPFVVNANGRPSGLYYEIWQTVAAEMGVDVRVTWVDSFPELLSAIESDQADVAVAPLTPSADRETQFDFTSAIVTSGPSLPITNE